jgi:predicted PolB exonuclease-like 3'-5' exonuclease
MLENVKVEDVLFLDIETVPLVYNYTDLNDNMRKLWDIKMRFQEEAPEELYNSKAGVLAEFSKIVCISVGFLKDKTFRIKSFYGDDEKLLLQQFAFLLDKHFFKPSHQLCAHNGKEFDFPFIGRRMLVNGVRIPEKLNIASKKPWEVTLLDTMELWKFGDRKSYTSLNLLAAIFNIPTPKDDIDGSDVARVYWEERDLSRIVTYCQKDVLTVAQVLLRFRNEPLIPDEAIVMADETQSAMPQQPLPPRSLPQHDKQVEGASDQPQLSIFV